MTLIEAADTDAAHRLGSAVPIGPRLALEVIDDGMARSLPRWRNRIIACGLQILSEPVTEDLRPFARILVRFAETGDEQRQTVADGLRQALGGTAVARQTASHFQDLVAGLADERGAGRGTRGLTKAKRRADRSLPPEPPNGWETFDAEIATHPVEPADRPLLEQAAAAVHHLAGAEDPREFDVGLLKDVGRVVHALEERDAARGLDTALVHIIDHEPLLPLAIRGQILPERCCESPSGDNCSTHPTTTGDRGSVPAMAVGPDEPNPIPT